MEILYWTDGKGRWYKRIYKEKCNESLICGYKCQGCKGHSGVHWAYASEGSFCYGNRKSSKESKRGIGGGIIPPGTTNWISPEKKYKDFYAHNYTVKKLTDKKDIKRIESGKLKINESVNYPFS
jgi:hypothetical protein